MKSRTVVQKAIHFQNPPRVPLLYLNRDVERSDLRFAMYRQQGQYANLEGVRSEWGYDWKKLDETMGQPENEPIRTWEDFERYTPPDPAAPGRFDQLPACRREFADRYLVGSLGISGFNQVTFLRGFENTLADLYLERERIERLIDIVFDFESEAIRRYGQAGLDAVSFSDDWGTQQSLMISPELWREVFRPRYQKQFDLAHGLGMDVYFHSCGMVWDILPDLIDIGADVLNLNQPDLFGVERLGREFGGKVCFNCPVDHQTVALKGSRQDIFDYVRRLNDSLGRFSGGFIGYIEDYHSIGMSEENYQSIVEAFEGLSG